MITLSPEERQALVNALAPVAELVGWDHFASTSNPDDEAIIGQAQEGLSRALALLGIEADVHRALRAGRRLP